MVLQVSFSTRESLTYVKGLGALGNSQAESEHVGGGLPLSRVPQPQKRHLDRRGDGGFDGFRFLVQNSLDVLRPG